MIDETSSHTLIVRDPGVFDLHARVTDPGTGATSDVIVERIARPEPAPVQCGSLPGSAPLVALAAVLVPRRRPGSPRVERQGA